MSDFPLHTAETAADAGGKALERAEQGFGFAPNLIRVLAEAPSAAHAYLDLGSRFGETSLSPVEQQVVLLTTSFENGCDYCMAAHSMVAGMAGMDGPTLTALRSGDSLPDARLEALRSFTRTVVRDRARVSPEGVRAFLAAGFTRANVLEVITGVAMKTLSNYTNHLADTPLDEAFADQRWEAPVKSGAAAGS
ncbi:MAG: carboxymuconolactone decarboxylase family protein [Longimicrobiales bacterium]|nr:carboxymuconolactone decarboxylase family protein [Longimicrobiales bacterium]